MRKSHLLIVAAVLLIGMGVMLWPSSSQPVAPTPDNSGVSTKIETLREARRSGQVDRTPASVSGTVVAADGKLPIEGAVISLALRKIDGALVGQSGRSAAPLTAISDAEGHFHIPTLRPGRYSFSAAKPGYIPQHVEGIRLEGGQKREGIDFALVAGGHKVSGVVTDIGGGPVSFAFVRARKNSEFSVTSFFRAPLTATTNAQGEYALHLEDGSYRFEVFHQDYRTEKKRVAVGGQNRSVDFTLTPGSVIEGIVKRSSDDKPVVGATVSWNKMGQSRGFHISGISMNGSAETDEEGRFALRGLGSGALELRAFSAHSSSKEPKLVELAIAETISEVVVYVDEAYVISGFVLNKGSEEEAASDVMLGAYNLAPGALFAAETPSASDGYFEIHGVQPGSYTVGALAEERLPNFFGESVTVVDQDVSDLIVKVDRGYSLSGQVTPAQVATITLQVDLEEVGFSNMMQAAGSFLVRAQSAEDGSFTLRGVGKGSYTLVASAQSGDTGTLPVEVQNDVEGLRVEMEHRAFASGVVSDSNGHPVEGAELRFVASDGRDLRNSGFRGPGGQGQPTISGAEGRFKKVGLSPGAYELRIYAGSQLAWADASDGDRLEAKIVQIKEGSDRKDLRFAVEAREHSIGGTVESSDGTLLADAWVTAQRVGDIGSAPDDSESNRRRRRWSARETPVLSDEDGAFVVSNLRSGLYELTAEGTRGGAKGKVSPVQSGTNVQIRIEELGGLSGKVSKAGAPVKDYVVVVDGPQQRRIHVLRDDGSFYMPRLESGEYSISITSSVGAASSTAEVVAGNPTEVAIPLAAYGSVSGVLLDTQTGEPLPNISAVATMGQDESSFASNAIELMTGIGPSTGESGEFRVGKLAAGEGTLYFMDPKAKGFDVIAKKKFSLAPGEDLDLGQLHGTLPSSVPKDKQGDLGMTTGVATQCPVTGDREIDETLEGEHLWITSIAEDGPAQSAGAQLCDRILSAQGIGVAQVGPRALEIALTRGLEAESTMTLAVKRPSGETTISIRASMLSDEDE